MPRSAATPRLRLTALTLALIANAGFFLPDLGTVGKEAATIPFSDKIVHVGIFALTTWAFLRFFMADGVGPTTRHFPQNPHGSSTMPSASTRPTAAIIAGIVVGLFAWAWVIEGIQSLLPARSADPRDVLADSIGIAVGFLLVRAENSLRRRPS